MANIDANVCGDIHDMDFVVLNEKHQLELPDNPKQNCTKKTQAILRTFGRKLIVPRGISILGEVRNVEI